MYKSLFAWIVLAVLVPSPHASGGAAAQETKAPETPPYRLGPLDRVRIEAYSWRATQDQVYAWAAINRVADYAIGPAGEISVPLVGEIAASGLTTSELADKIGTTLQESIGMAEKPNVSVEISVFRPYYVIGDVDKPGDYAFRPGLTVMQALAKAGGTVRDTRSNASRVEREIISGEGDLNLLASERVSLLIRRARLEAELRAEEGFSLPKELNERVDESIVFRTLEQERQLFAARREGFLMQVRSLEQLKDFLSNEVTFIQDQVKAQQKEVDAVNEELNAIRRLAEQKLVTEPRRLGIERNRAQVEGERVRLASSLMRAKQEISRTDLTLLDLRSKRASESAAELAEVNRQLDQVVKKMGTAEEMLQEAETARLKLGRAGSRIKLTYKIVRRSDGAMVELAADETSLVEPGDTVKVEATIDAPSIMGAGGDTKAVRELASGVDTSRARLSP